MNRNIFAFTCLLAVVALPGATLAQTYRDTVRSTFLEPPAQPGDYSKKLVFLDGVSGVKVRVIGLHTDSGGVTTMYGVKYDDVSGAGIYADNVYVTSIDAGATWQSTGAVASVVTPKDGASDSSPVQLIVLCQHPVTGAPYRFVTMNDGAIYRNISSDWTAWHRIDKPSAGLANGLPDRPMQMLNRPDSLAVSGLYMFYGNYNNNDTDGAHVWRSGNCGSDWEQVLDLPSPVARHVHGIAGDPAQPAHVYVSVGDGNDWSGLYRSESSGAPDTFVLLANNRYGINIAFAPASSASGPKPRVLLEGDGPNAPHVIAYHAANPAAEGQLDALIWPDEYPPEGESDRCVGQSSYKRRSWAGSGHGIKVTANGDLFYITTGEGCSIGARDGVWIARGPHFTTAVLLEDLTGQVTGWTYSKTFEVGGFLFNDIYKVKVPQFKRKY